MKLNHVTELAIRKNYLLLITNNLSTAIPTAILLLLFDE